MSQLGATPTSFITLIARPTSTFKSTSVATANATSTLSQGVTSFPDAPSAGYAWSHSTNNSLSPATIIGIVTAIVLFLVSVPLIAVVLQRYNKARLQETVKNASSDDLSVEISTKEDLSLRSIIVTKELQRISTKLSVGDAEQLHLTHAPGQGWSQTDVRAG